MAGLRRASRFGRKMLTLSLSAAWGVAAIVSLMPPRNGLTWHLPVIVSVGIGVMALYSWAPHIRDDLTSERSGRLSLLKVLAPRLAYLVYISAFGGAGACLGAAVYSLVLNDTLDPRARGHAAAGLGVMFLAIVAWRIAQRLDKRERHRQIRPALSSVDFSLKQAMDALSAARDDLISLEKRLESKADDLDRRNALLVAHGAALMLDPQEAKRVVELHRLGDRRAQINTALQVAIGFMLGIVTPFVSAWLDRYFQLSP